MKSWLVAVAFIGVCAGGILDNQAVYKIINKEDSGVLSMKDSDSSKVYLKTDVNAATEKWRAKKPTLMRTEYELKPTSDESNDLTADDASSSVRALATSSNGKYWHIRDSGQGAFEVKNYKTQTCLTSQGLNRPVTLSACNNNPQQQWKFKML